jgi:hypothetical protein
MTLFDFVTYSIWFSIIVGIVCFKSLKTLKILLFSQIISAIVDFLLIYVLPITYQGTSVKYSYCFLKPFEYIVFVYIFYSIIIKNLKSYNKYYFVSSIIMLFSCSFYNIIFNFSSKSVVSNVIILEGCFTLILVLLYFRSILKSDEVIILYQEPLFWIATGLLFFFTGNIIATGFYHRLRVFSPEFAKSLYLLNFILGILLSILISLGYIISSKNNKVNE